MTNDVQTAFRDFLLRFQKSTIQQTGRRPVTPLPCTGDEDMLLPGCKVPGYSFWQPMPWIKTPDLGSRGKYFHDSICALVCFCRYLEIPFILPVPEKRSQLSCLYNRTFLLQCNAVHATPQQRIERAVQNFKTDGSHPLCLPFAVADENGQPAILSLRAEDGMVCLHMPESSIGFRALEIFPEELLSMLKFRF